MTHTLSLNELAIDYAKRTGFPHKQGDGARLAFVPDIANAMLAFHEEASQHHGEQPEPALLGSVVIPAGIAGAADPIEIIWHPQSTPEQRAVDGQPVEVTDAAEYNFIHECIMRPDEVIKHVSFLWREYALCPDEQLEKKALELKRQLLASFPMREAVEEEDTVLPMAEAIALARFEDRDGQ